jgi:hypothetical protein
MLTLPSTIWIVAANSSGSTSVGTEAKTEFGYQNAEVRSGGTERETVDNEL